MSMSQQHLTRVDPQAWVTQPTAVTQRSSPGCPTRSTRLPADSRSLVLQAGKMARALLLHVVCCCLAASTVDASRRRTTAKNKGPQPLKCCDGSQMGSGCALDGISCVGCFTLYSAMAVPDSQAWECRTAEQQNNNNFQCFCDGPPGRINPYLDRSWMKCSDSAMAVPGNDCPTGIGTYILYAVIFCICAPLTIWCRLCGPTLASAQRMFPLLQNLKGSVFH